MSSKNLQEYSVYRIISGEIIVETSSGTFKLLQPNLVTRLEAASVYESALKEYRFNEWITKRQCLNKLVKSGLCTRDIDNNLKEIEKRIEDLKVKLYESLLRPKEHKSIREQLKKVKDKQQELLNTRHMFDHLTLEGFAEMAKRQHILFKTVVNLDGSPLWESKDDVDSLLLENIAHRAYEQILSSTEIRRLARNEPWRSYWNVNKANPFGKPSVELTDEQRTIIMYSKMYDSIYEHPEAPPDNVINDDDLCDGWLIKQRREGEKKKTEKQLKKNNKKRNANLDRADEVFLVAQGESEEERNEDARQINSLNSFEGVMIKKQREATIKRKGGVAVDAHFQDRKVQMQQQSNQKFIDSVKGNK